MWPPVSCPLNTVPSMYVPITWELTFHEHINQRLRLQICLKFQIGAREPKPFWTAWQEAFPTLMGSPFSLAVRHRRSHQATLSLLLRGCCVSPLIQRTQFSLWASVCFHHYIGLWKARSGEGGGLISLHHLSNRRIVTPLLAFTHQMNRMYVGDTG